MAWQHILGHDEIIDRFRTAVRRGRLASSFLFTGRSGIGKRAFALNLARALLCQRAEAEALAGCGECPACVQVTAGTHPDLLTVSKPADRSFIPLDLLIGSKEKRMREGLCHDIGLKPYMGGRRVAIIDDADYFNQEGANSLLKTLEEPPPGSVLILIGTSPSKQLPTIRSRCQLIRFQPLAVQEVAEVLVRRQVVDSPEAAARLAELSEGSVELAISIASGDLSQFRTYLFRMLAASPYEAVRMARSVQTFVEEAGKEAPARRRRLHQAIQQAVEFYRAAMYVRTGASDSSDRFVMSDELTTAITAYRGSASDAADRLERCLTTAEQVDRNANLATLIEFWCDSLA